MKGNKHPLGQYVWAWGRGISNPTLTYFLAEMRNQCLPSSFTCCTISCFFLCTYLSCFSCIGSLELPSFRVHPRYIDFHSRWLGGLLCHSSSSEENLIANDMNRTPAIQIFLRFTTLHPHTHVTFMVYISAQYEQFDRSAT